MGSFIEELRIYIEEHYLGSTKHTSLYNWVLCCTPHKFLFFSIALIMGGFFVPPLGIIDGSVLTAVGELLMFGVLAQVPKILDAVRNGKSSKLQKGDFGVEVSAEAKEEN